ncbi:UNVERIFIED_ORG: curli production assembly/transport component CsgE [Zoogloea ramigera]|uniref:Curli production assembly/transport component CsgE n=1 Tax=Duganella zoogloeoides TaxID=75659 RepID=A0ABZ0XT52_9BURK|nr:CsgE family curli-type amyloid fiber assembly protein [Duganella zoogloeoides]WQH02447.1 CsgE family curli-type amyloid fiber assembly protein [Duganella zoogloeoides]
MFLRVIFIAATVLYALRAAAADAEPPRAVGVITVQTMTTAGHDFSQHFLAAWRDQDGSDQVTLAIRERPSARFGSEMWIDYAQRTVLQLRLPPARAALPELAANAVQHVWATVQRTDAERKLFHDADLAPDEF